MPVKPCDLSGATNEDIDRIATPERVSMFWRYAKANGFGKGMTAEEIRGQIANKFNVSERAVARILDKPKTVRKISDEVKNRQRETARFLASNRRYLTEMDKTLLEKTWDLMVEGPRTMLLAWHGPVIPNTHAIDVAFTNPVKFLGTWFRAVAALHPRTIDRMYKRMQSDPFYHQAIEAGAPLARGQFIEGFAKKGWAPRAMDAVKGLVYQRMKYEWQRTPEHLQTPEYLKLLAQNNAHAAGMLVRGEKIETTTRGVRRIALAPQLIISRWAKTVFDPITTVKTIARTIESKRNKSIRPPTPEERRIAWVRTRNAAIYLGSVYGSLNFNQAMLEHNGSNQKINKNDPLRGDFLAYKAGGYYFRPRGSLEVIAFLSRLAMLMRHPKFGKTPEEAIGRYAEYKLTPAFGVGEELIRGKAFLGRPLPWSSSEGTSKAPRLEYPEWVAQHGPIFLGHGVTAFYESLREQGVDVHDINNVMRSIVDNPEAVRRAMLEGGAEFFGINLQKDRYIGK